MLKHLWLLGTSSRLFICLMIQFQVQAQGIATHDVMTNDVESVHAFSPDLGPNVLVFEPGQADAQRQIRDIFQRQERSEFGSGRYALLFKPGVYDIDIPVGFYTHVAGLGELPQDVIIKGGVWTDAAWRQHNATCNFWRCAENLTIAPPNGVNIWATSQAAPLRRIQIQGDLQLSSGGWSSGGYMADCDITGTVDAGTQQQWFSRNSQWQQWRGGAWNMLFVGCPNAPVDEWPEEPYTVIRETHAVREKPYLFVNGSQRWLVKVPSLRRAGTSGLTWDSGQAPGQSLPLDQFYVARPERDTADSINAALRAGKHLLLTPGIYSLTDTLVVSRPDTVVFGLGLPSLVSPPNKATMVVEAGEGVILCGVLLDAGPSGCDTLLQIGLPDRQAGSAENPISLHDIFCRVGGYREGKAQCMVTIHDDHVLGDNLWLWRADHGKNVGWDENTCETGLRVEGDALTIYALFVEHTQSYQTVWNGNGGRVFFYQSEMPYDPPSQAAWGSKTSAGFASYKVGDHVTTHEAWGLGIYHVFKQAAVVADNAIETPSAPGVSIHHAFTYRLHGGQPGSGIRNVVNGRGGDSISRDKATVK